MLPVAAVVVAVVPCHYDSALLRLEMELSPNRKIQYAEQEAVKRAQRGNFPAFSLSVALKPRQTNILINFMVTPCIKQR